MKTTLVAAVVAGIWLAPTAYAAPPDQAFLSFLAAHNVAVDANTAISAAHITCEQITNGEPEARIVVFLSYEFPTMSADKYWIIDGAQKAYCPNTIPDYG